MKRKWLVNYEQKVNNFEKHADVESVLLYGKPNDNAYISYVIPVYQRADLLEKTLASVLNQQEVDFEWNIVIVDNEAGGFNNTQRLVERINSNRIVYYRNEKNIGVDGNYNRCIELARSPWIAMIHGDDLIMNDHLKKNAEYIKYIRSLGNKRKLAYICQRYVDFSNEEGICLERIGGKIQGSRYSYLTMEVNHGGKPQIQSRKMGVITGYYASIPSFGTIMNREILLSEGGFSDELGICEDVITPFKLAEKYDVYLTPVNMGFHRIDRNESVKVDTVLRIYEAMTDFREYMYTTVWWGKLWRLIARDILNSGLSNYCVGQSRFCGKVITVAELDAICKVKKVNKCKEIIYNAFMVWFCRKYDLKNEKSYVEGLFYSCHDQIDKAIKQNKYLLIYGAGVAAKNLIPILKKTYGHTCIKGCAVSEWGSISTVKGVKIDIIDNYMDCVDDVAVITATVNWEYQLQMNKNLHKRGFSTIVNLLI